MIVNTDVIRSNNAVNLKGFKGRKHQLAVKFVADL